MQRIQLVFALVAFRSPSLVCTFAARGLAGVEAKSDLKRFSTPSTSLKTNFHFFVVSLAFVFEVMRVTWRIVQRERGTRVLTEDCDLSYESRIFQISCRGAKARWKFESCWAWVVSSIRGTQTCGSPAR